MFPGALRVLFVLPNLEAGGVQCAWSTLLPGLRRRGFDARLLALDGGGPFAGVIARRSVPLEILNMRHQADVRALVRSSLLRGFRPDVVVSQSPSGLYVGWAVTRWRGARLIFSEHRQIGLSLTPRRELMVRLIRRWIDLVVVVTPGQIQAWIDRGYPPERAVVIPNGVERADPPEARSAIRLELGIPDGAVVATLVASLRPEKRVTEFVHAVRSARALHPELLGLIVGDGSDRPAIDAAVNGDSAIRLLGHRDDVPRLLKAADVFVLSSQYEASPVAVLEAMSAGLPVVAYDVGAVGDMVEDGQTGFLVSPGAPELMASKLAQLTSDSDLRRALGAAGQRRYLERWDAELMVERYATVIRDLAEGAIGSR
jgi:glycosyltransferase involved in cell wall biosynthesis